jgi:NADH dehydrogenase
MGRHRVLVVGGGFAGLHAARALHNAPAEVILLDRRNFHLFQPLLYQVATGGLSPANIAAPLRSVLKRQRNTRVLLGEVVGFDVPGRRVLMADGELAYDTLVVATGVRHHYFGNSHWEALAPGLKTIEDATSIRRRILGAFEEAERLREPDEIRARLTFVIVGAGPTGVELAGTIGEMARHTLRNEFRQIDPADATILLIEGRERVLPPYPSDLSAKAARALARLGVTVRTGALLTELSPEGLTIQQGDDRETIRTQNVFWAAGVQASPLGQALAQATGAEVDHFGRVVVQEDLTLPGHKEIFVIGDLAHCKDAQGQPLPALAPVAIQQGRYVASVIGAQLRDDPPPRRFRYKDRGRMATIGRAVAVAHIGRWRFNGLPAWLAWLFVHLTFLIGFENRLLVLTQWAWNYFTKNRSARLITGEEEMKP